MRKFRLNEAQDLEIELKITYLNLPFIIKYDIDCDGDIDLLEVCADQYNIMDMIHDEMLNDIKKLIVRELKKQDESNYIDFMVA